MKKNDAKDQTLAICFGQFGPYHHARVGALQLLVQDQKTKSPKDQETRVVPVQIAAATTTYEWKAGEEIKRPRDEEPESAEADGDSVSPAGAGRGQTQRQQKLCEDLRTLCAGVEEEVSPLDVFLKARRLFRDEKVDVAFLPSYSPARYFALFAAAKSLGIRTVMMNESHAGTEQATGWKRWIKRQIVKSFDAALVGGEPHKRHFASLGIPAEKIFTGYDAVDSDFFAQRADEIRAAQRRRRSASALAAANGSGVTSSGQVPSIREAYGLPERYFLSLGRMVEKKNLATLIAAYGRYCDEWRVTSDKSARQAPASLVFVGSGELEGALREQARALGLRVVDRTGWGPREEGNTSHGLTRIDTDKSERLAADRTGGDASCRVIAYGPSTAAPPVAAVGGSLQKETEDCKPTTDDSGEQRGAVYFYGFRQIEENAVFYALAEAFVLPSLKEEWGLVVNEAMAAGLPVIVSRTAGCAEDLLPEATASRSMEQEADARAARPYLELRSNGFAFDPRSVDALSEALRRIADCGTADGGAESAGRPLGKPAATLKAVMGKRSREIVAKFGCENFARQAMRAAEATRH